VVKNKKERDEKLLKEGFYSWEATKKRLGCTESDLRNRVAEGDIRA